MVSNEKFRPKIEIELENFIQKGGTVRQIPSEVKATSDYQERTLKQRPEETEDYYERRVARYFVRLDRQLQEGTGCCRQCGKIIFPVDNLNIDYACWKESRQCNDCKNLSGTDHIVYCVCCYKKLNADDITMIRRNDLKKVKKKSFRCFECRKR